jgi:hypothetical protein
MSQKLTALHGQLSNQQALDLIQQYRAQGRTLTLRIEDLDDPARPWCYDVRDGRIERGALWTTNDTEWAEATPGQILLDN